MPETYQDLSALVEATEGYTGRRYLALYLALRNGASPQTLAVLAALADQAAEAVLEVQRRQTLALLDLAGPPEGN